MNREIKNKLIRYRKNKLTGVVSLNDIVLVFCTVAFSLSAASYTNINKRASEYFQNLAAPFQYTDFNKILPPY